MQACLSTRSSEANSIMAPALPSGSNETEVQTLVVSHIWGNLKKAVHKHSTNEDGCLVYAGGWYGSIGQGMS